MVVIVPGIVILGGYVVGSLVVLLPTVLGHGVKPVALIVEDVKEQPDEAEHDQGPEDVRLVVPQVADGLPQLEAGPVVQVLCRVPDILLRGLDPSEHLEEAQFI